MEISCLSGMNLNSSLDAFLMQDHFSSQQEEEASCWLRCNSCPLFLGSGLLSSIDLTVQELHNAGGSLSGQLPGKMLTVHTHV